MRQQQITPKIITANGYMKLGATGEERKTPATFKKRPLCKVEKENYKPEGKEMKRLHKVIAIILKSTKVKISGKRAYQIVLRRKRNHLPINIYGRPMGEHIFIMNFHSVRKSMGIIDGRVFSTNFIRENMGAMSVSDMATYLSLSTEHVKKTIRTLKKEQVK